KSYEMFADCLVEDTALAVKGRINEREGTISVFASDAVPVDISAAETGPEVASLTVEVEARHVNLDYVHELRATLRAHRGSIPLRVVIRHGNRRTRLAVDRYPVDPSPALFGELKALRGTRIASSGS
ncbi:DNA polymerase III subunit alpha, partial [Saccharopolyspora sp. WRP15-2]|nr:DNA polymerase III subunit alpha [Saccharopolyspora oryzae]